MKQRSLDFSATREAARPAGPPAVRGSRTSEAAAVAIRQHAPTLAALVLELVGSRGQHGATDHEIAEALFMLADTARARRCELRDAGAIRDSGLRRLSPSGRASAVWVVASSASAPIAAAGGTAGKGDPDPIAGSSEPSERRVPAPIAAAGSGEPSGSPTVSPAAEGLGDVAGQVDARELAGALEIPDLAGQAEAPPGPGAHCPRCGASEVIRVAIHGWKSTRVDCAKCRQFLRWARWYGQPAPPIGRRQRDIS